MGKHGDLDAIISAVNEQTCVVRQVSEFSGDRRATGVLIDFGGPAGARSTSRHHADRRALATHYRTRLADGEGISIGDEERAALIARLDAWLAS